MWCAANTHAATVEARIEYLRKNARSITSKDATLVLFAELNDRALSDVAANKIAWIFYLYARTSSSSRARALC